MPVSFSKSKSPLTWEREWKKELDALYLNVSTETLRRAGETLRALTSSLWKNSGFSDIKCFTFNHRTLCTLQHDLRDLAGTKCVVDDFENRWQAAGENVREKHYFEAMRRVCDILVKEDRRRLAPEISLVRFQARNGQGYLEILRSLMPEQLPPNQYARVENPTVDALSGIQGSFETVDMLPKDPRIFTQRELDLSRCLFMSAVVWHTLLSFYDLTQEAINVRLESYGMSTAQRTQLESAGFSREMICTTNKEHKKSQKQCQWMCTHCGKLQSETPEGTLKACSKCNAIDRNVVYCSGDCQIKDWKDGYPPHKTICGQPTLSIPTSTLRPSPAIANSTIPPPAPTYRRSIALIHQIALLEQDPSADYFLISRASPSDIAWSISEPALRKSFLDVRNIAFAMGERGAVGFIYKILQGPARSIPECGIKGLDMQLRAEFGLDADELQESVRLAIESLTLASRTDGREC